MGCFDDQEILDRKGATFIGFKNRKHLCIRVAWKGVLAEVCILVQPGFDLSGVWGIFEGLHLFIILYYRVINLIPKFVPSLTQCLDI